LGLVPATIAPYIIERIGPSKAAELMLSGRSFTGVEAEKFNLVNSSVPSLTLENELENIKREFLKAAPNAARTTKQLIRKLNGLKNIEETKKFTAQIIAEARASEEGMEGIQSFFDSRKANWLNESIQ
jgi:methylglutaconyl-CoA hydratase